MAGMNPRDQIAMAMMSGGGAGAPHPDDDMQDMQEPEGQSPGQDQGGPIPQEMLQPLLAQLMPEIITGVISALKQMSAGDQGGEQPPPDAGAQGGAMMNG